MDNFSSDCGCVTTNRLSNGKSKVKDNNKNGNKYLSRAYLKAANFGKMHFPYTRRKYNKGGNVFAVKALSNKLAKATYPLMGTPLTTPIPLTASYIITVVSIIEFSSGFRIISSFSLSTYSDIPEDIVIC